MDLQTSKKEHPTDNTRFLDCFDLNNRDNSKRYLRYKRKGLFKLREYLSKYSKNPAFSYFILNNLNKVSPNVSFDFDKRYIVDQSGVSKQCQTIIHLELLDANNRLNTIFEVANTNLEENGLFIGVVGNKLSFPLTFKKTNNRSFTVSDQELALNSILPLVNIRFSEMSNVEILGRLSCFGFEIKHTMDNMDSLFFIAVKKRAPIYVRKNHNGFLIKLPRVCKDGKLKNFYKIRTMYPYAEYLQDFVFERQGLQSGGKINKDYRISKLGKFLRKYWIDELPMLINLLKRDIKIVGVRPLSKHFFNLYSMELQELRIKTKPGLIPPFYADLPQTLDEIMESEMKYLKAYEKNPVFTDLRYFYQALKNIIIKGHRSK